MKNFAAPVPVIRPALPRDKADVFEFTKFIWDGNDYVGHAFPEWLADPRGQLLAVEYAGKCIGTGKVTYLAPGQWWLEGFRIDPKFQGLKIGSRLDAASNRWWDEHGDGTLRLMTSSKRVQVHHLSEQRGFIKVGNVYGYKSEPLTGPAHAFTPLAPTEAGEAVSFFDRHAPGRLLNLGWKFVAPNADSLRSLAEQGFVWRWRGGRGLIAAWEDEDGEGAARLTVGLEACAEEDTARLLEDFRRLAGARGANVAWMNVVGETHVKHLEAAGYKTDWQDSGYLYERRHP